MTPDVLTVSPAPCRLVGGAFAVLVQVLLCVVAFVALFFKWVRETARYEALSRRGSRRGSRLRRRLRRRSVRPSKFVEGTAAAQAGILRGRLARVQRFSGSGSGAHQNQDARRPRPSDQCAWYLINYIADCFVGILRNPSLRLLEWTAAAHSARERLQRACNYYVHGGNEPSVHVWAHPRGPCPHSSTASACSLLSPARQTAWAIWTFCRAGGGDRPHPEIELVVVMVVLPSLSQRVRVFG